MRTSGVFVGRPMSKCRWDRMGAEMNARALTVGPKSEADMSKK